MGLSIPHVFSDMAKSSADWWNANFAAIVAKLNGNIGDDEVQDKAFSESKINFNKDTGHDHSGGSKGKAITLDEDQVDFDEIDGHNHDGSSGGKLAALAEVADDGNEGTVKLRSGTVEVTNGETKVVAIDGFDEALIALDVYWENEGGEWTNKYLGIAYTSALGVPWGYYITGVSRTQFIINNELVGFLGAGDTKFSWRAIGV